MKRQMHAIAVCALCIVGTYCPPGPVSAAENENDRVTALEQKLDRSLKLIEQLTARVKELEAQRAGAGAAAAASAQNVPLAPPAEPSPQIQQRLDSVEQQLTQIADSNAARGGGGDQNRARSLNAPKGQPKKTSRSVMGGRGPGPPTVSTPS